jgi:hypothetical protein
MLNAEVATHAPGVSSHSNICHSLDIRHRLIRHCRNVVLLLLLLPFAYSAEPFDPAINPDPAWARIAGAFEPPAKFRGQFDGYPTLLKFNDGRPVKTSADWAQRRNEIVGYWQNALGAWPPLLTHPKVEFLDREIRDGLTQHRIRVEIAPAQLADGYLLVPPGPGPFPAVLVPYYEPETSIGRSKQELRDFGYQLARRGFVTLSIGSPGGDARKPETGRADWQPLSFLAYVAANCHTALAQRKEVDPERIGVVGHSYGGKWAMFAACFYNKFACGVWSDPGIVFDEKRSNVNYWEPWYLGRDPARQRTPGLITPENPRTGAYERLVREHHDLQEVLALMAPRPFLVSGGSEDCPDRWLALNRVLEVYDLLGVPHRVGLTSRKDHTPTAESNEQIFSFFEVFLKRR